LQNKLQKCHKSSLKLLLHGTYQTSYARLFELTKNKQVTVSEMFVLEWGVGGEAWKWRRRLFAWEEGLVGKCVERLSVFVFAGWHG